MILRNILYIKKYIQKARIKCRNKLNKEAHGGDGGSDGVYLAREMTESTGSIARKAEST